MTNKWTWEIDDDDYDYTDFSDVSSIGQKVGMLAIDKMKISENDEDKVPKKYEKLSEEEEMIEELRAADIEYKDGLDKNCLTKCKNWKEENKSTIVYQGRVPVLIGDDYFFVTKKMQPNPSKSKKDRTSKSKKMESSQGTNPFCQSQSTELVRETNPFRPSTEAEPNAPKLGLLKKASPIEKDELHMTVAQQIDKSVRLQKKNKKKAFKKFEAETNFNPEESTGPTIGMADHKYYTAREIYSMNRFAH